MGAVEDFAKECREKQCEKQEQREKEIDAEIEAEASAKAEYERSRGLSESGFFILKSFYNM